jgi:hypothetical protein
MKKKTDNFSLRNVAWGLIAAMVLLFIGGWLSTCLAYFLVCLIFDLEFSWLISIAIWLVLCLIRKIF